MAAGALVGPLRLCKDWEPTSDRLDTSCPGRPTRLPLMSVPNRPSGHQHNYKEENRFVDRPRLPSLSNFLEVIGRPDFATQKPHQTSATGTTSLLKHDDHPQPATAFAARQPWSPSAVTKHSLLPPFDKTTASPQKDGIYSANYDWQHRSSISTPSLSHSDRNSSMSYSIPTPSSRHPSVTLIRPPAKLTAREGLKDGQSMTYMYDDGASYQNIHNGDTVNPKWGTTKAGKPRKRLGQACNTCREKKIKCDPSFPKCTQCQRFGRECKFEAPRHNPKSPKLFARRQSPFSDNVEDQLDQRRSSIALTETSSCSDPGYIVSRKMSYQHNEHATASKSHDSEITTPSKRIKLHSQSSPGVAGAPAVATKSEQLESWPSPTQPEFSQDTDPFAVSPKLTEHYLKAYFSHTCTTGFSLVPERLFMQWARKEKYKSTDEKLVLYCMMAAACKLTRNADRVEHEAIFSSVASEGVTQAVGQFSVQLIHARLVMCLYEFQIGSEAKAWDLGGAAMRAACAMRLNTEDGVSNVCRSQGSLYTLDTERLAECLRRTFWLVYVMDRVAVSCLGYAPTFNGADLFLRLPCIDSSFDKGRIPNTRIFDGDEGVVQISEEEELSKLSSLAFLAQIASLSCDAHVLATRARYQGSSQRRDRYTTMRNRLEEQLSFWDESYIAYLRLGSARTEVNGTSQPPRPIGGLQIIMHHAYMVLYRYGQHRLLSPQQINSRARQAYDSARNCLGIAQRLVSVTYQDIQDHHIAATNAVSGYAIVEAVDILTSAGLRTDFWGNEGPLVGLMMKGAVPVLEGLAEHWKSARHQRGLVSNRTKLIFNALHVGPPQNKTAFCVAEPMIDAFSKEEDIIYGIDRFRYFGVMDWHNSVHDMGNVIEISNIR